ncbi:transposase [Xanthomonas arboricola]
MASTGLHFSTCQPLRRLRSRLPPPASRIPPPESRIPPPASRIPNPESRIPNPESRIPNPESRIPNPESRIPALEPYRTVWYVRDVLPRTTDAWQLPLGHPGPALRGREP